MMHTMSTMKDRSKFDATVALALIAAGFVLLVGGGRFARADEPAAAVSADSGAPTEVAPVTAPPSPPPPLVPATQAPMESVAPIVASAAPSWFARPALTLAVGEGNKKFKLTLYGFAEVDYIFDTTQSYGDSMGPSIVARTDTHAGNSSRSQFSMRNSRLGFAFESPVMGSVRPTAVLEGDFFGYQRATSEGTFFNSPTYRVRHAYVRLQTPYIDFLMGQSYDLFGWQNYSYPCTLEFLGLPNQLFSRNPQLRLSHLFNAGGVLGVDVAASAGRPVQRDSQVPDGSAGLRLVLNNWKGITTPGNVGTVAQPASIGVSGIVREFRVNAFAPPPVRNSNSATGWGMSVDAFLPVIPAAHDGDRSNRLTFTASFVKGAGIADLITSGGNAKFPTLPNPAQATPAPAYEANLDPGLVTFDANGIVHIINWTAFRAGLQYYLPPTGRLIFAANFTQAHSDNMSKLYLAGGSRIELLSTTVDTSRYVDANLLWDATPALRLGLSGQYTEVEYLDGNKPHNIRMMGQSVYQF